MKYNAYVSKTISLRRCKSSKKLYNAKNSSMERHTCLMIFIFIIYGGFFIICGSCIIIRDDFFIVFGT